MIVSEARIVVATEEELTAFFTTSRAGLVNFAVSLTRDRDRSEDIVAEAYVQVVGMIRKGKGPAPEKLESYAKVCIRNEAFRQAKRHSNEIPTPFIEELADEMLEAVGSPDHEGTWDEDAATRAFNALSDRSQSILRLTTIEGCRVAEIATQLGISERAVVSAAFRARQGLRTRYLVEVAEGSHTCRDTRIDYLASYAREQLSARREKKLSAHLQHCESCDQTLRRMRALRLPSLVIVGIAATGGFMSSGQAESAQAAEFTPKGQGNEVVRSGSAISSRTVTGGVSIVALLAAAAFLLVFLQPNANDVQPPLQTASQQGATPATEQPTSPRNPQKDSNEDPGPVTSQPTEPSGSADENTASLPDGIHSVEWSDTPNNYAAGNTGARLLLSVGFDQSGTPGDYNVFVTLPSGVSLDRASAGCTANGSTVRCDPPENLVPTDLFRWQFYVDIGDNFSGDLPTARVVKREA